jgi:hypothetical protein
VTVGDYDLWVAWGIRRTQDGLLCDLYWQTRAAPLIALKGQEYFAPSLPDNAGGLYTTVLLIAKDAKTP